MKIGLKFPWKRVGDDVRVHVFNTGKNIPEEDIPNIWQKFYKVDKARTREYGGNGIGLSIVKASWILMEKDLASSINPMV